MSEELARARRELAATAALIEAGFPEQAVSRAYYAAFYSAEAALLVLGETRSKHSGVVSAFGQLVVRPGGFDADAARVLRTLLVRRTGADYSFDPVAVDEAQTALADATRFVEAVEEWIATQPR